MDAGAQVVVGHGPHRLRGAEIYKGGPIFYSLGNFLYQTDGLDFRAADFFDAGKDLYSVALGASADRRRRRRRSWSETGGGRACWRSPVFEGRDAYRGPKSTRST